MNTIFNRCIALLTLLAYLVPGTTAFAASSKKRESSPHVSAVVHSGEDYIDIYSTTFANLDGDNHYIHVQKNRENRYVFEYCKDGVSISAAREGMTPRTHNCSVNIGNKEGYTRAELMAQLKLMRTRGNSEFWWGVAGDVGAGIVIFVALSAIEYFTGGGAAPVAIGDQSVAGVTVVSGVTRLVSHTFLKTVGINATKIIVSTFLGVFVSNQAKARAQSKYNDSAFNTPYEQKHISKEIERAVIQKNDGTAPHGNVIITDEMQSFEADLSQVLGKIQ